MRSPAGNPAGISTANLAAEMEKDIKRLEKIAARFSQIGSTPELGRVNLNQVAAEVAEYYRQRLPYAGSGAKIEEKFNADIQIPGNAQLLSWVLENLIKNSLEAVDPKIGKIQVWGSLHPDRRVAVISVSDNGRGIPARDQKKIFSPGFTTKKRGWGLGLSLGKRIVEQYHNGRIYLAESIPGVKTEIKIELPLS